MIGSPFEAPPRSLGTGRCAYWPDTCFLEVNESPELVALFEKVNRGEAPEMNEATMEIMGVVAHENTHWIQAAAFGSGIYQASLDQTATQLAESFLVLISPDIREQLFEQRSAGYPIVKMDKTGAIAEDVAVGPVASRIRRHWAGFRLLRRALDSGVCPEGFRDRLDFYFGLAQLYFEIGDQVSTVALLPDEELRKQAFARSPTDGISLFSDEPIPLATSAIAECAAVLDEHWLYAYHSEWCRRHGLSEESNRWWQRLDSSWTRREGTFYGDGFRVFGGMNPDLDLNDGRTLATLGIVCALALDGNFATTEQARVQWQHVYPPSRFRALSGAVKKVGTLPAISTTALDPKDYSNWAARFCEAANLPIPTRQHVITKDLTWFESPVHDLTLMFRESYDAASQLLALCPAAIVAPSEAEVYLEESLLTEPVSAYERARKAPLLILNDEMSSLHYSTEKAERLGVSGIYQRLMIELMCRTGPMTNDGRPPCAAGQVLARRSLALAEDRLAFPLPPVIERLDQPVN